MGARRAGDPDIAFSARKAPDRMGRRMLCIRLYGPLSVVVTCAEALQPLSLGGECASQCLGQLDIVHRHDSQPCLELPHFHLGIRQF